MSIKNKSLTLLEASLNSLTTIITDGIEETTQDGEVIRKPAAPAYYAAAISLLKLVEQKGEEEKEDQRLASVKKLALPFKLMVNDQKAASGGE